MYKTVSALVGFILTAVSAANDCFYLFYNCRLSSEFIPVNCLSTLKPRTALKEADSVCGPFGDSEFGGVFSSRPYRSSGWHSPKARPISACPLGGGLRHLLCSYLPQNLLLAQMASTDADSASNLKSGRQRCSEDERNDTKKLKSSEEFHSVAGAKSTEEAATEGQSGQSKSPENSIKAEKAKNKRGLWFNFVAWNC